MTAPRRWHQRGGHAGTRPAPTGSIGTPTHWWLRPLLATVAFVLSIAGVTTATAPAQALTGANVVITDVSPATLQPGEPFTIRGTITNNSNQTISSPAISFLTQRSSPESISELESWLTGAEVSEQSTIRHTWGTFEDTVEPGETKPWTIEFEADRGLLAGFPSGPYGLAVEFYQTRNELLGSDRSLMIWESGNSSSPAHDVGVLVKLTATTSEWSTAIAEEIPVAEVAAPRLTQLITATRERTVSYALDPALLETQFAGESTTTPPSAEAAELTTVIAELSNEHDLLLLPWGDPDYSALATHSSEPGGELSAAQQSITRGVELADARGVRYQPHLTQLRTTPGDAALQALNGTGIHTLIIDRATTEEIAEAVEDTDLFTRGEILESGLRFDTLGVDREVSEVMWSGLEDLDHRQLVLGSLALVSGYGLDDSLLLSIEPPVVNGAVLERLDASFFILEQQAELDLVPLRNLVGDTSVIAHSLPSVPVDSALTSTQVRQMEEGISAELVLRDMLPTDTDASLVAGQMLAASTMALDSQPLLREQLLGTGFERLSSQIDSVSVEFSSTLNLIAHQGDIPVTVRNTGTEVAVVNVALEPHDLRLRAPEQVEATIEPGTTRTVRIPVTAIANGNVGVDVRLYTPTEAIPVGTPSSFTMRVRADWESTGTIIIVAALAGAFLIGLTRSIRRSRTNRTARTRHGR